MSIRSAIAENVAALRQGVEVLRRVRDEDYRDTPGAPARGGIGSHVRHCIEAYRCFLDGLEERRVDFDARRREPRLDLEPAFALECLGAVMSELEALTLESNAPLTVKADAPGGGPDAWCDSTVGRELRYLLSHTIHHYAILGMHLRRIGVDPGVEFGVAPSTLAFWREQTECAPLPGSSNAVATSSSATATSG